jgi:hypothetical protein
MSDDSNFDWEICYLLCRGKGMKKFSANLKHGVTGKK